VGRTLSVPLRSRELTCFLDGPAGEGRGWHVNSMWHLARRDVSVVNWHDFP